MSKKNKSKSVKKITNSQDEQFRNSLSQVVLGQNNPFGAAQITQTDTLFKNLRYYLLSNNRQLLSQAYVETGIIQTIVDVPVDDALSGGVIIKTDQLSPEQITDLQSMLEQEDDIETIGQAMKWNRLYGGAGVIVMTDQDPATPLDINRIAKDGNLEFRDVDMWELYGDRQYTGEDFGPNLELTGEFYQYYSEKIHKSRVMIMKGKKAPSFVRPRLRGWGMSVTEPIVKALNQYLKTMDLTFEVLDEFKLDIFKIKGFSQALLSPNGTAAIQQRVALANMQKNYQNALSMDAEDDYTQKQLSFTGIAEIMKEIRMQLASELRMPLTKLFGISATGFTSGEDDIENYNSMIESQMRSKNRPTLLKVVQLRSQQMYGLVPDDLSIDYHPLRILSSEQEETVKTQKFNRVLQSRSANVITDDEFREAVNKDDLLPNKLEKDVDLSELQDNDDEVKVDKTKKPQSVTKTPEAKT